VKSNDIAEFPRRWRAMVTGRSAARKSPTFRR
jgi:hypothetical protein